MYCYCSIYLLISIAFVNRDFTLISLFFSLKQDGFEYNGYSINEIKSNSTSWFELNNISADTVSFILNLHVSLNASHGELRSNEYLFALSLDFDSEDEELFEDDLDDKDDKNYTKRCHVGALGEKSLSKSWFRISVQV